MSRLGEPGNIAPPQHRRLVTEILALKRAIRQFRAALEIYRDAQKRLNTDLDRYSLLPPESKLRLRAWAIETEALVKKNDEAVARGKEGMNQAYRALAECMDAYDTSPFRNWHEIAQLLGISHVLLDHFLKANEDALEALSLQLCASHHAEVWGEKEHKRLRLAIETLSRDTLLLDAVVARFTYLLKTDSPFRYQVRKGFDSFFPGVFPPERVQPERNFEVIAGRHERTAEE